MPGILGIISQRPSAENAASLERMRRTMIHESFYTSGTYTNDKLGVWAGWVCHRGAFSDCQPIWNERRDICLIFSGENCVDPAEIRLLKGKGHEFAEGDASYLVHLYEEQGTGFLAKLNGLFSGLLVDLRENKAMLFNDRYGMNRIYYHQPKTVSISLRKQKHCSKCCPNCGNWKCAAWGNSFLAGASCKIGRFSPAYFRCREGQRGRLFRANQSARTRILRRSNGNLSRNSPPRSTTRSCEKPGRTFCRATLMERPPGAFTDWRVG